VTAMHWQRHKRHSVSATAA